MRLGSIRVIVEQWTGRLKQHFPILKAKYIGARSGLTEFICICAHFTNVDVDHHPLHAGDPAKRDVSWGEHDAKSDDEKVLDDRAHHESLSRSAPVAVHPHRQCACARPTCVDKEGMRSRGACI
jgi:hypothetical protein